mmetsp:Transcript_1096/g.4694  ORF Transcript_1096/g.4694 Transcript_1096/m.4694 type:complete len:313 (-) Transcript_1096:278-1216(-)
MLISLVSATVTHPHWFAADPGASNSPPIAAPRNGRHRHRVSPLNNSARLSPAPHLGHAPSSAMKNLCARSHIVITGDTATTAPVTVGAPFFFLGGATAASTTLGIAGGGCIDEPAGVSSSRHANDVTSSTTNPPDRPLIDRPLIDRPLNPASPQPSGLGLVHPVANTTLPIHLASGNDAEVTTATEPVASARARPAASIAGSILSYSCAGAFTDSAGASVSLPTTATGTTGAVDASFSSGASSSSSSSSSSSESDRLLLAQSLVKSEAHGPIALNSATEHSVDPSGRTGNGSGAVDFGSWPGRGIASRVRVT